MMEYEITGFHSFPNIEINNMWTDRRTKNNNKKNKLKGLEQRYKTMATAYQSLNSESKRLIFTKILKTVQIRNCVKKENLR